MCVTTFTCAKRTINNACSRCQTSERGCESVCARARACVSVCLCVSVCVRMCHCIHLFREHQQQYQFQMLQLVLVIRRPPLRVCEVGGGERGRYSFFSINTTHTHANSLCLSLSISSPPPTRTDLKGGVDKSHTHTSHIQCPTHNIPRYNYVGYAPNNSLCVGVYATHLARGTQVIYTLTHPKHNTPPTIIVSDILHTHSACG